VDNVLMVEDKESGFGGNFWCFLRFIKIGLDTGLTGSQLFLNMFVLLVTNTSEGAVGKM
jgi:hypothetical protein